MARLGRWNEDRIVFAAAGGHDHTGAVGHGTQLASAALGNSIVVSSRLADNAVTRLKAGLGVYRGSGTSPNKRLGLYANMSIATFAGGSVNYGTARHGMNTVVSCGYTPLWAFGAASIVRASIIGGRNTVRLYMVGRTGAARVSWFAMGYPRH